MGSILSGFLDSRNDPSVVMVPPNLSGFVRVIISLPRSLPIEDVLADLVEKEYINGVEEHSVEDDGHYVIKRDSERQTDALIAYLNNTFGFIAHRGYVRPSKNIVVEQGRNGMTTTDVAKSTHIALVQSPDAKNPNEQFEAFRREFDPETEFPKFERVDIEEIIHYTRPEDVVAANFEQNNNIQRAAAATHQAQASNALEAMARGVQFDVTETEAVRDREAIKIDYVEKARKLRNELQNNKLRALKKPKLQKRICEQFKYDHMLKLIEIKRRKYGIDRANRIYALQRAQRLRMAEMKQRIDPHIKPSQYEQHQQAFWKEFDYKTK